MTKSQIQSSWKKIISETHKRAKFGDGLKNKRISQLGELLLCAQVFLEKIKHSESTTVNTLIFQKTMNFYDKQMKKYVNQN